MNNLFSLTRFGRLFQKHTAEHWKSYLMGAGVLAGALLVVIGFIAYLNGGPPSPSAQSIFFVLFLLGAGFLFTSSIFVDFGEKSRAIAALSLPASHLEKYVVGWLYSYLFFVLAYTGIFFLVDGLLLSIMRNGEQPAAMLNLFSPEEKTYGVFLLFAALHGVALWGSIFFEKLAFIKTAVAFFVVLLVVTFLNFQVMKSLLGTELRASLPFLGVSFIENQHTFYRVQLPDTQQNGVIGVVLLALTLLLWLAAYARLREKQL